MLAPAKPRPDTAAPPADTRRRTLLWIAVAVVAACGAVWGLVPLPDAAGRLGAVPRQGPNFESADVRLSEAEKTVFARVNVLHRIYRYNGREFYLTMIDGTRDRHVVHDPRYCFQGAGWTVVSENRLAIPGGEATWMRTAQGKDEAQALYWFSDGRSRHSSVTRFWGQTTLRRLTIGRSGPEPILIFLQSFGDHQPDWSRDAAAVIATLGL